MQLCFAAGGSLHHIRRCEQVTCDSASSLGIWDLEIASERVIFYCHMDRAACTYSNCQLDIASQRMRVPNCVDHLLSPISSMAVYRVLWEWFVSNLQIKIVGVEDKILARVTAKAMRERNGLAFHNRELVNTSVNHAAKSLVVPSDHCPYGEFGIIVSHSSDSK